MMPVQMFSLIISLLNDWSVDEICNSFRPPVLSFQVQETWPCHIKMLIINNVEIT